MQVLTCYSIFICYKENNINRNTKNCVFQQEPVLSIFQQQNKKQNKLHFKEFSSTYLISQVFD